VGEVGYVGEDGEGDVDYSKNEEGLVEHFKLDSNEKELWKIKTMAFDGGYTS